MISLMLLLEGAGSRSTLLLRLLQSFDYLSFGSRPSQRIQKWGNRPGYTKAINYNFDTAFVMILGAEECPPQLEVTVNEGPRY